MISDKICSYLLLGTNLGDCEQQLANARDLLSKRVGDIIKASSIYETAAWGKTDQPNFLNQAIAIETSLTSIALLREILKIEEDLGRVRKERWGSRIIDIDILFYGNDIVDIKDVLKIPHPEMQNRKFVLLPLNEISPKFVHPSLELKIEDILANCKDELEVLIRK